MEEKMQITLKAARVNAKLTQAEAAKKAGVSTYKIKRAEKKPEHMTLEFVLSLCQLYGVHYNNIFLPINYPLREVD